MYEYITGDIVATEAVMTLSAFDGVVVLVEGPTDLGIFQEFLPKRKFRVVYSINKDIALDALCKLDAAVGVEEARARVIALVDADFDRPLGRAAHARCFLTDFHDLELMMLWSPALTRLLRECGNAAKIASHGGEESVRQQLLKFGAFIGAMRLYAKKSELAIDFSCAKYDTYFDRKKLVTNPTGLCQGLYNANRNVLDGVTLGEFVAACDSELSNYQHDQRDLTQGHDLVCLLGLMLRGAIGALDAKIAARENLEPMLRLAYHLDDWRQSNMAKALAKYLADLELPSFFED